MLWIALNAKSRLKSFSRIQIHFISSLCASFIPRLLVTETRNWFTEKSNGKFHLVLLWKRAREKVWWEFNPSVEKRKFLRKFSITENELTTKGRMKFLISSDISRYENWTEKTWILLSPLSLSLWWENEKNFSVFGFPARQRGKWKFAQLLASCCRWSCKN